VADRIAIDQPAEKSATKSTNWIEVFNTNLKNLTALITFAILIAGATWGALEKTRIESLKEQVAFWKEQIAERDKTVVELKAARDPDRKKIDELLATNQKLVNDLAVAKDNLKQSRDNNAELQKQLNTYANNSSIISEIRPLEKRQSEIDRAIHASFNGDMFARNVDVGELRRQSDGLHVRIVILEQKLACEPK
jgi:septal ring factor EnvC (AmiA/AmiB activator)